MIHKQSKKHLIGFPIGLIGNYIFTKFDLMQWSDFRFHLGGEIWTPLWLGQSLFVLLMSWGANFLFEYFQQRNLKVKPPRKDTYRDCRYFAISAWVGYLIVKLFM
jgi:hypothetical protein